jgi:hypothetical protein
VASDPFSVRLGGRRRTAEIRGDSLGGHVGLCPHPQTAEIKRLSEIGNEKTH